jgi:hypothetical protein
MARKPTRQAQTRLQTPVMTRTDTGARVDESPETAKEPFALGLGQQSVHVQFPLGCDVNFSVGDGWYDKLYRDAALVACRILTGIVQLPGQVDRVVCV